jgi:hypothetical protein
MVMVMARLGCALFVGDARGHTQVAEMNDARG